MEFKSQLRTDILPDSLTEEQKKVRVNVESQYNKIISDTNSVRLVSKMPSKNINEVQTLVLRAIEDYHARERKTKDAQVEVTYDSPDTYIEKEVISMSVIRREPGSFSQGSPFEGSIKNLKPILREEKDDPDNPGYKIAILGYWYDNILRLTCWARTNKVVNERALWVERVMEQYRWWFKNSGTSRFLYWGRGPELVEKFNNKKIYGRTIDFYVRTEMIIATGHKTLEEITVNLSSNNTIIV